MSILLLTMSSAESAPLPLKQGAVEMTAVIIIIIEKSSMGCIRETPH